MYTDFIITAQIYDDHLWAIIIIIIADIVTSFRAADGGMGGSQDVARMISDFLGCVTWMILVWLRDEDDGSMLMHKGFQMHNTIWYLQLWLCTRSVKCS